MAKKAPAKSARITIPSIPPFSVGVLQCSKADLIKVIRQRGESAIAKYIQTRNDTVAEYQKTIRKLAETQRKIAVGVLENAGFTVNPNSRKNLKTGETAIYVSDCSVSCGYDDTHDGRYADRDRSVSRDDKDRSKFWQETHSNVIRIETALVELEQRITLAGATPQTQKAISDFFDGIKFE
jgi:hypothetical protein